MPRETPSSQIMIMTAMKSLQNGFFKGCSRHAIKAEILKSFGKQIASHVFNKALKKSMADGLIKAGTTDARFKLTKDGYKKTNNWSDKNDKKKENKTKSKMKAIKKKKISKKMAVKKKSKKGRYKKKAERKISSQLIIMTAMKSLKNGFFKGCSRHAIKAEISKSFGKQIAAHVFNKALKKSLADGLIKAGSTDARFKLTQDGYKQIKKESAKKDENKEKKRKSKKEKFKKKAVKKKKSKSKSKKKAAKKKISSQLMIMTAIKSLKNGYFMGCSRHAIKAEITKSFGKQIAAHVFNRALKKSMISGLIKAGKTDARFKLTKDGFKKTKRD